MKKFLYLTLLCLLCGCNNGKLKELEAENQNLMVEVDSLTNIISTQEITINESKKEIETLKMDLEKISFTANERLQSINLLYKKGDFMEVKNQIKELNRLFPNHPETIKANELLDNVNAQEEIKKKESRASLKIFGLLLGAESKEDALNKMKKQGYNFEEIGSGTYASYKKTSYFGFSWDIIFMGFERNTLSYVGLAKGFTNENTYTDNMLKLINTCNNKYGDDYDSDFNAGTVTYKENGLAVVIGDRYMNNQHYITLGFNDIILSGK